MKVRKYLFVQSAFLITLLSILPSLNGLSKTLKKVSLSPNEMLKKVDEFRNPSESYTMKVSIKNSGDETENIFEVFLKGNSNTIVKTLEPKRNRGRSMLMKNEDMWAYIPNLKRSMRVNMSQKLTGQAAIGDICRMRWHGDYNASFSKKKTTPSSIVLELEAIKKGLTYSKIEVTIDRESFRPKSAVFKTKTGKSLKNARYEDFKMVEGKERPHRIILTDYLKNEEQSIVTISEIKSRSLPDSMFNQRSFN